MGRFCVLWTAYVAQKLEISIRAVRTEIGASYCFDCTYVRVIVVLCTAMPRKAVISCAHAPCDHLLSLFPL